MSLRAAIQEQLAANGGVAALVSTRIYSLIADYAGTLPYLVIEITDEEGQPHLRGASGLVQATVGIDCITTTSAATDALVTAVREAMDTASGTFGTGDDATSVRNVDLVGRTDEVLEPRDGSRKYLRVRRLVFTVWYRESIPA